MRPSRASKADCEIFEHQTVWALKRQMMTLVAVFLLLPALLAGTSTGQENEVPHIQSTTSEVLLDFVVRDKHARIIRDLRPDEIQVFEDGLPQRLRHFEFYDEQEKSLVTTPAPAAVGPHGSGVLANAHDVPMTADELRNISVVSVVIGNLDPRGRKLTLSAMRRFAKTDLGPNTYVGVFSLGKAGLYPVQPYTNDSAKVSAAVEEAMGDALIGQFKAIDSNAMGFGGPGAVSEKGGFVSHDAGTPGIIAALMATHWVSEMQDVYMGSMGYLTPLRTLVDAQAQIPGRKVMLLFSPGILVNTDTVELLHSVISAANRANVGIYALDTRGLAVSSTQDDARRRLAAAVNANMSVQLAAVNGGDQLVTADQVVAAEIAETSIHSDTRGNLAELAEGTGGALLPDTLDLGKPLREAIESSRMHYEATYAPTNTSLDGSFRKIEVKVTRPGATVFARSGYYAVPLVDGREVYPFEVATLKTIHTKPDLHQFDFHAATLEFRGGAERDQFAFVFQAPTKDLAIKTDKQWAKVHVCVTALINNSEGQVVEKISKDIPYSVPLAKRAELEKGTVSFTVPFLLAPGHYTVDTASVDRYSMRASVIRSTLDAKQDSGFTMSDVTVVRRVDALDGPSNPLDPLEARGAMVTPELSDVVKPDATGNVKLYAAAYPPAPADAPVEVTIELRRNAQLVQRSPATAVPLDKSGAASVLVSLPVAKLPPGHYEEQVSFEYNGEKVTKKAEFTLAGDGSASN